MLPDFNDESKNSYWRLVMRTQEYIAIENEFSAHNYKPLDVVLERGEGVWLWDIEGKKYMDFLSAYSAVNQGHSHPRILKIMVEQAAKLPLTSRAFRNNQLPLLAQELCQLTGYEMMLPMNTGVEAVETALKAARKWGYNKKKIPQDRAEVISCSGNFHGRTIVVVGFSTEPQYRDGFGPFADGFVSVPYGDPEAIEGAVTSNTAALIIEPIQGEGGVIVPPDGYLKIVRDICNQNNILFIADEIQTGLGRTGRMFACDWEGVKPDIMVIGKALSGGFYPVSAVLTSKEIMNVFKPGDHGSTFGGNPLGCAIAREALHVLIDEKLIQNAEENGNYMMSRLQQLNSPNVKEIRGKGLLIGVELKESAGGARRFCEALMDRGILCKETHKTVVRFAPPLVITRDEINWALDHIEEVLKM
jgi:ornithine--oxo-acid transaminase